MPLESTIEAATAKNRKEEIEQQYMSLLESRVKHLQALVDSQNVGKDVCPCKLAKPADRPTSNSRLDLETPAQSQTPINSSDSALRDDNWGSHKDDMKPPSHRGEGRFGSQVIYSIIPIYSRNRLFKFFGGATHRYLGRLFRLRVRRGIAMS